MIITFTFCIFIGLDLHFWRKICKNCKCGKESHDVQDDDVYGWTQFQLLGSKPIKSRKVGKRLISFDSIYLLECVLLKFHEEIVLTREIYQKITSK